VVNLFALAIPMFSMTVDRVVPNHAVETLWVLAVGAVLVLGFDFVLRTLRAYIVDSAGKRIDVQLSARIMEKVLGLRMDARPPRWAPSPPTCAPSRACATSSPRPPSPRPSTCPSCCCSCS
jgi:ABC-type bacteriocin/lantibiotic exporter with double-glycine peptidase domain